MEADEVEMSKVELQSLIRDRVQKTLLSSSALNEKFILLRSLLSRKQRQINRLSTICQSVAKCEKTVKELYSLLGWEYGDEDSDKDDAEPAARRHRIHQAPPCQPPPQSLELEDEEMRARHDDCESPVILMKKAVVVLTKLRRSQITAALRAPSPEPDSSEGEILQWVTETYSSDSDFSWSDFNAGPNKRRKIDKNDRKCRRTNQTSRGGKNVDTISDSKTPTGTAGTTSSTESNGMEISPVITTPDADANNNSEEETALQANTTNSTIQSEKITATESENIKAMESEKIKATESEKIKATESGKVKAMESGKVKAMESGKVKATESEKIRATESGKIRATECGKIRATKSGKIRATESGKIRATECEKTKATKFDKRKSTELGKQKTIKSNISQTIPQANPTTSSQANTTKLTPQSNTKTGPLSNVNKTSTLSADIKGGTPLNRQSQTTTSTPPTVPRVEIAINMNVLARRKTLSWKPGKITEIIIKGDGKVKYKVVFEKGKCLVSSHHIAHHSVPLLDYLVIGARVVVKCEDDPPDFKPGILAEVPSRKNRMRFLVFIDDHTPVYCSLPSLHLVCNPLADPLDDIPDENHRSYMREYLKAWPYPPMTQYKVGQMVNVEYNGVQQKCEVLEIDSSLIKVVFTCDQQKEWIFQGSMRLEHIVNVRKDMLAKMNEKKKSKPS